MTIKPALEYDNKIHTPKGPLLLGVMKASGVVPKTGAAFFVRVVDGYAAQISAVDATRLRFIIAAHLDGRTMALGGLRPRWAVYDADRFADMAGDVAVWRLPLATYPLEVKQA